MLFQKKLMIILFEILKLWLLPLFPDLRTMFQQHFSSPGTSHSFLCVWCIWKVVLVALQMTNSLQLRSWFKCHLHQKTLCDHSAQIKATVPTISNPLYQNTLYICPPVIISISLFGCPFLPTRTEKSLGLAFRVSCV